ncbi:MAG: hypothetical protein H0T72_07595 [Chloroflexia bacterium]|nr:hypothetical protein [Chloroflexia bacterium]
MGNLGRPRAANARYDLLYVTSDGARERLDVEAAADLASIPDDRLIVIPERDVGDIYAAVQHVRPALEGNPTIEGVVIIGDYETVPSRPMLTVNPGLLPALADALGNPDREPDMWIVWNDDPYGDCDGDFLAELPVSRLPIVPTAGGLLGAPAKPERANAPAIGFRGAEFPFADGIYRDFVDPDPANSMWTSPETTQDRPTAPKIPWETPCLGSGDLAADRLYLVLHASSGDEMRFLGSTYLGSGWQPIAVDADVLSGEWESSGVIFGGICWGALTVSSTARLVAQCDAEATARTAANSLALAFLDHGANAFVGFTGLHHIPAREVPNLILGAPLHQLFWKNIATHGWPPAKALFRARAEFIQDPERQNANLLSRAFDMKTFWSATCLGRGW